MKYLIESDTSVYGDGFRAGYQSLRRYGLGTTIDHILMTGRFPHRAVLEFGRCSFSSAFKLSLKIVKSKKELKGFNIEISDLTFYILSSIGDQAS